MIFKNLEYDIAKEKLTVVSKCENKKEIYNIHVLEFLFIDAYLDLKYDKNCTVDEVLKDIQFSIDLREQLKERSLLT
ncbi:hypothetical protein B617_gp04 [Nonlabens phage P12024S]|uniref:Uncharacterized protein n=1 Tax=Nonlabens phage P12024S TaxID=1168478 RepID=I6S6K6_9CAUD|nr:hypothetical protein B617_gp04 [Nonlabens phage P12024S]AFM54665.1 hypothetical protein P12024S_04 [Nonlabens phage P12024S]